MYAEIDELLTKRDVEFQEILDNMEEYGGSFVQALANCFRKADHINADKLKKAFPELLEEYKKFSTGE